MKQKVLHKATLLFSLLFGVFLTLNTGLSNNMLALFFVCLLLVCIKQKHYVTRLKSRRKIFLLSTIVLFILTFLSFLLTDDYQMGIKRAETRLSFCLIPIFAISLDYRVIKLILRFFYKGLVIGSLLSSIYLIIHMVYRFNIDSQIQFFGYFNTHHKYSDPLSIHATYLSLYYLVALCVIHIKQKLLLNNLFFKFVITLLLIFSIMMLSSRVVIIAGTPVLVYSLLSSFSIRIKVVIICVLVAILAISFLSLPDSYLISRFKYIENELLGDSENQHSELRFSRWNVALDVIRTKPVFGYGLGMEKTVLDKAYKKNGLIDSSTYRYDSHNQFLSTLITSGIIGFVILCLFFIRVLNFFIQKKSWFNFLFLFLVISLSIVETTFNVNTFTTFFAFMVNMNLFKYS